MLMRLSEQLSQVAAISHERQNELTSLDRRTQKFLPILEINQTPSTHAALADTSLDFLVQFPSSSNTQEDETAGNEPIVAPGPGEAEERGGVSGAQSVDGDSIPNYEDYNDNESQRSTSDESIPHYLSDIDEETDFGSELSHGSEYGDSDLDRAVSAATPDLSDTNSENESNDEIGSHQRSGRSGAGDSRRRSEHEDHHDVNDLVQFSPPASRHGSNDDGPGDDEAVRISGPQEDVVSVRTGHRTANPAVDTTRAEITSDAEEMSEISRSVSSTDVSDNEGDILPQHSDRSAASDSNGDESVHRFRSRVSSIRSASPTSRYSDLPLSPAFSDDRRHQSSDDDDELRWDPRAASVHSPAASSRALSPSADRRRPNSRTPATNHCGSSYDDRRQSSDEEEPQWDLRPGVSEPSDHSPLLSPTVSRRVSSPSGNHRGPNSGRLSAGRGGRSLSDSSDSDELDVTWSPPQRRLTKRRRSSSSSAADDDEKDSRGAADRRPRHKLQRFR